MNDRIKELAQEISKYLREEVHPHAKIVIDSDGITFWEVSEFIPSEEKVIHTPDGLKVKGPSLTLEEYVSGYKSTLPY